MLLSPKWVLIKILFETQMVLTQSDHLTSMKILYSDMKIIFLDPESLPTHLTLSSAFLKIDDQNLSVMVALVNLITPCS